VVQGDHGVVVGGGVEQLGGGAGAGAAVGER
jgi:hypothetical protein